jgi:hypothetical protein
VIKVYKIIILPAALMGVKFGVQIRPVIDEPVNAMWKQSYKTIY